jgi:hypothetical protein
MHEPVTLDDWDADEPRAGGAKPFWPVWIWPLLVWLPLDEWHARFARDLPRLDPGLLARSRTSAEALAWLATALMPLAALAEAGGYGMLWAARGRRLPLAATAVAVLLAGTLDLAALQLLDRTRGHAGPLVAMLAGARAYVPEGAAAGAFTVAFGTAGAFTLGRCALFAAFQAHLVPCRGREALAMTCGAWLVSHVVQWWVLELLQGRSVFR